jgi:hypothetical protein
MVTSLIVGVLMGIAASVLNLGAHPASTASRAISDTNVRVFIVPLE